MNENKDDVVDESEQAVSVSAVSWVPMIHLILIRIWAGFVLQKLLMSVVVLVGVACVV